MARGPIHACRGVSGAGSRVGWDCVGTGHGRTTCAVRRGGHGCGDPRQSTHIVGRARHLVLSRQADFSRQRHTGPARQLHSGDPQRLSGSHPGGRGFTRPKRRLLERGLSAPIHPDHSASGTGVHRHPN